MSHNNSIKRASVVWRETSELKLGFLNAGYHAFFRTVRLLKIIPCTSLYGSKFDYFDLNVSHFPYSFLVFDCNGRFLGNTSTTSEQPRNETHFYPKPTSRISF